MRTGEPDASSVNLATLISLVACTLGAVYAIATWIVSTAPGTRGFKVFSVSCLLASLFALSMASLTISFSLSRLGLRFGFALVGLHGVSWFVYTAQRAQRALYRWEKWLVTFAASGGVLCALFPNAIFRLDDDWVHGVPALGIHYHDAHSTWLGDIAFLTYCSMMTVLVVRALRRVPHVGWAERAEAAGLTCLVLCGISDGLVSSDLMSAPYLLDVGFVLLVVLAGMGLTYSYVENARALASMQEELVARERLAALGEMAAVVAHEVRNPVAIIFNASASLRKMPVEAPKLVGIIEEEAHRLKRLAADLLDFARPRTTHMSEVALRAVIEGAVSAIHRGRDGNSQMDVPPASVDIDVRVASVHADEVLLRQAIVNLLANAVEAPGRIRPVRVRAYKRGDGRVQIDVIDDGQGIPECDRPRVSRPFFTTRPTGIGLGLAIVRRIAEVHGGALAYRETPGGGATFSIDVSAGQEATEASLGYTDQGR